ncbi:hypothetical protein HMPREF9103_02659 [Lentilactobacillus parafarraginis F0439]|uniref:Uncharacterized protein n=1 Tax=Lentilactobacillus parafarraginis F0439 TaxID=797515 RepID=G9ZSE0_9LACO|nr:hypothetical protein HMPREF9103_02659 [Lentilactobacillus parafarraginis F0439]
MRIKFSKFGPKFAIYQGFSSIKMKNSIRKLIDLVKTHRFSQ